MPGFICPLLPSIPSSMAWAHRRTQPHLWLGIAYLRDRNQDLWLAPTARCLESLISPAQCGDGREVAMICRADIRWWWQDDTWSLAPHLIMTQLRSPRDIIGHWRLRMTPGHPGSGSYSIGTGNGSWLCLIHFIIPSPAPLLSLLSPLSSPWCHSTGS